MTEAVLSKVYENLWGLAFRNCQIQDSPATRHETGPQAPASDFDIDATMTGIRAAARVLAISGRLIHDRKHLFRRFRQSCIA